MNNKIMCLLSRFTMVIVAFCCFSLSRCFVQCSLTYYIIFVKHCNMPMTRLFVKMSEVILNKEECKTLVRIPTHFSSIFFWFQYTLDTPHTSLSIYLSLKHLDIIKSTLPICLKHEWMYNASLDIQVQNMEINKMAC